MKEMERMPLDFREHLEGIAIIAMDGSVALGTQGNGGLPHPVTLAFITTS